MKMITRILAVVGCVAMIALLWLLILYLNRDGIVDFRRQAGVDYYYPADLKMMNLPRWRLTNTIPLSPDVAVKAAIRYANGKHPATTIWDVDRVYLEKQDDDGTWSYDISLIDRQSGRPFSVDVRVLMDGNIWEPTKEERKDHRGHN
jgi:hypothetical protein